MKHAESYLKPEHGCRQGGAFVSFESRGYTCIDVLPFLKGKPWDDVALGFVHALRPSHVRATTAGIQLDSQAWRVTVYLEKNLIRKIEQEVEVGLPEGIVHGSALDCALKYGINSPQTKWHALPGSYVYDGISGRSYKVGDDGNIHNWPTPKKRPTKK